jgi:hypothetical protein
MNFGIAVLLVLAVWSVVSILVSVTIGSLADYRDSEHFHLVEQDEADARAERDRIAS